MLEALLRALRPSGDDLMPYGDVNVNQMLQSWHGTQGGPSGTPYGMYGDFGTQSPEVTLASIFRQFIRPGGAQ